MRPLEEKALAITEREPHRAVLNPQPVQHQIVKSRALMRFIGVRYSRGSVPPFFFFVCEECQKTYTGSPVRTMSSPGHV